MTADSPSLLIADVVLMAVADRVLSIQTSIIISKGESMDTRSAEPTTVTEMLREEFLKSHGISPEQLANALGTDLKSAEHLLTIERRLTPDEAAALARMSKSTKVSG